MDVLRFAFAFLNVAAIEARPNAGEKGRVLGPIVIPAQRSAERESSSERAARGLDSR
jgi:hypothetical protein